MSKVVEPEFLLRVFAQLRERDVALGIGDLRAVLRLLADDWPVADLAELRADVQRLWCVNFEQEHAFAECWQAEAQRQAAAATAPAPATQSSATLPPDSGLQPQETSPALHAAPVTTSAPASNEAVLSSLPLRAPQLSRQRTALTVRWPLTPRAMAYGWQHLRAPQSDGPWREIDLDATVNAIARQGHLVAPVLRRCVRHHARLLLLIDRRGSMTPFHALTNDLLETAQQAPTLAWVRPLYFHDVASEVLYADPLLNEAMPFDQTLTDCGAATSVLIVSDAGAARGHFADADRIFATAEMLATLRRRLPRLVWLNPMPPSRWTRTSAQVIQHLVPMFPLDQNGLTDAIKAVRGQYARAPQRA